MDVGVDGDAIGPGGMLEATEQERGVLVPGDDGVGFVAALDDVKRDTGKEKARQAWHPRTIACRRSGAIRQKKPGV